MRGLAAFFFVAMIVTALFAFGWVLNDNPLYSEPITVMPYQFASFLFWVFMLLFFATVILSLTRRKPGAQAASEELRAQENTITGGFTLALFFLVIAAISGLFGFGAVASTLAGIAMILFWVALALGLMAMMMGLYERYLSTRTRR